jgi:hypothetical protein
MAPPSISDRICTYSLPPSLLRIISFSFAIPSGGEKGRALDPPSHLSLPPTHRTRALLGGWGSITRHHHFASRPESIRGLESGGDPLPRAEERGNEPPHLTWRESRRMPQVVPAGSPASHTPSLFHLFSSCSCAPPCPLCLFASLTLSPRRVSWPPPPPAG